jgi:hypothetical protein
MLSELLAGQLPAHQNQFYQAVMELVERGRGKKLNGSVLPA